MVNLEKFVNAARNKGAWPVFITPLERRCFIDEEHLDIGEHTDYVAAMKQTAENLNVPRSLQHEPRGNAKGWS